MKRAVAGFLCGLMMFAACSLGEREEWAEDMHDAFDTAQRVKTASAFVQVDFKPIDIVGRSTPDQLFREMNGIVDFRARRSRTIETTGRKQELIFDDLVAYLPRSDASEGKERWVSTSFLDEPEEDVDVEDRRFSLSIPMVSPVMSLELLMGALTGSTRRVGAESVRGVSTTHFRANIAPDNAAREIDDEDRREGITRVLQTLGADDEVLPADVWIDKDGLVRRVSYGLKQQQDRVNSFRTTITTEYFDIGREVKIDIPSDVMRTDDFQLFVTEFVREAVDFA
jgi:hypothetical protein